jgi:hypothetical protein
LSDVLDMLFLLYHTLGKEEREEIKKEYILFGDTQ